ncbi:MAG: hypothetical protein ACKN94_00515 [Pirellulaceae bacterium]
MMMAPNWGWFRALGMLLCGLIIILPSDAGAQDDPTRFDDSKYDFSISIPDPWKPADPKNFAVPGTLRKAYSGAENASITLFVQLPDQAVEPRWMVDLSATSMEKNLKAIVKEKDVKAVAGKQAMWMVVEGAGTGGAIDGKGATPTTQQWVAIPREKDIVVLLLTCPAKDFPSNQKTFQKAMDSLKVGGVQTKEQSESK